MQVVLIPGPRNEELIEKGHRAKMNGECIWDICESSSEVFDDLYYACECGDMMIENQTKYFQNCLFEDEKEYYLDRMFNDLGNEECLKRLSADMEMQECNAWKLWGIQRNTYLEHCVTFAFSRSTDGWEYFYIDNVSGVSEDGIYDDPAETAFDAMNNLFSSFGFYPVGVRLTLDYESAVVAYEAEIK